MAPWTAPCAKAAAAALAALAALGSSAEAPGCASPGCAVKGLDKDAEAELNHVGLLQMRSAGVRGGLARGVSDGKIQVHFLMADRNGDGALNEAEANRFLNSLEDDRMDELARSFQPPNASEREAAIEAWRAEREKEKKAHDAEMKKREEERKEHEAKMAEERKEREAEMAEKRKEHEAEMEKEREEHEEKEKERKAEMKKEMIAREAAMKVKREEEQERMEEEREKLEEEWEAREEERKAREAEIAANRSKLEKAAAMTWDRCHGSFLIALDCTMIPSWEGGSNCICEPNTCGRWFGWCMGEDTRPLYNYSIRREHLANLSKAYGSLSEVLPEASELASTLQVGVAKSRFGRLFARADVNGDQLISGKEVANLVRLASATAQDRAAFRKSANRQPYDDEEDETVEERDARNNRRCKAAFQASLDCTMVPAFAGGAKCLCMGDACHNWLGQCAGLPRGTPSPEVRTNVQGALEQAFDTAVAAVNDTVQQVAAAFSRPPRPAAAIATPASAAKAPKAKKPAAKAAEKSAEAASASSE